MKNKALIISVISVTLLTVTAIVLSSIFGAEPAKEPVKDIQTEPRVSPKLLGQDTTTQSITIAPTADTYTENGTATAETSPREIDGETTKEEYQKAKPSETGDEIKVTQKKQTQKAEETTGNPLHKNEPPKKVTEPPEANAETEAKAPTPETTKAAPPETEPVTEPVSEPPVTEPPVTEPPVTEPVTTEKEEPSEPTCPDFTVYDANGNKIRLHDFIGKPIVLNFWATWCGPCKIEMPDFNAKYLEIGDEVQFLMVNLTDGTRDTVESVNGFIAENGYSFPVFYDKDYSAVDAYAISSIPTTYFIDADGNPVAYAKGAIDAETLQEGINMITEKAE